MVTQDVIDDGLAQELAQAGLVWKPEPGDQFRLLAQALAEEVFILSQMVIEAREFDTGTMLRFNGTTEWALDSVPQSDALWLPREDQLRQRLGAAFVRLEREPDGYLVTLRQADEDRQYRGGCPADAYARALLPMVRAALADV